ncbi:SUMF1/EgtB/PvdO family nonheme iron enzyme [Chroococcidiopsis sp. CCALA 051]|uniref:SUMF1/EgtB/PvdO family nonheme iron enzyme n=1 Tax=Chroococcidiopsis sp. CCALA 051 TaxID=869949 RepID=UPI0018EA986A|nr:SUMF1/EgtB/PvdO family nonheme iron enzyme [Chroococcidiopsis sp. CCALA 051]
MKSSSIKFRASDRPQQRHQLKEWYEQCRQGTLAIFEQVDEETFRAQVHPDFSPVGWHFGHIAYTESLWLRERSAGLAPLFPEHRRLFMADGLPKCDRVKLPGKAVIRHYLDTVRQEVLQILTTVDLEQHERLWRWMLQHESQHCETIAFLLQLSGSREQGRAGSREKRVGGVGEAGEENTHYPLPITHYPLPTTNHQNQMIKIPAGYFEQGNNTIDALDNERPAHQVYLDTYWIDRYPVTCAEYRLFMKAGGYHNPVWWSENGWQWLQQEQIARPLYWLEDPQYDNHPVCGVSWYEAEAYANFADKRLPTEAEWEKAASWDALNSHHRTYPWGEVEPDLDRCNHNYAIAQTTPVNAHPNGRSAYGCEDMLGNVWEWTACVFDGYAGFASYPYTGYSQVYFDGQHQVLKGGSWATRPWALRASFRNWYHPGVRQILAGFRCAKK